MSEKLIDLAEAARVTGVSYTYLSNMKRRHIDGFPLPKSTGKKGNPLYFESDFLEFKKKGFGNAKRVFDNQMAVLFLTRQRVTMEMCDE